MSKELQSPFIDLRIVDMRGVDVELLRDREKFAKVFYEFVVDDLQFTPVEHPDNPLFHKFIPSEGNPGEGMSGIMLIKESHVALHAWDEAGHLRANFETCVKQPTLDELPKFIVERFQPSVFMITKIGEMTEKHRDELTATYVLTQPDDEDYQPGRYRVNERKFVESFAGVDPAKGSKRIGRIEEEREFYFPQ